VTRNLLFALLGLTAFVLAALLAHGCQHANRSNGPPINAYRDIKPDSLTQKRCSLELAGSKYQAEIRQTKQGDQVQIDLMALGQVIESERYESNDTTFSVVDAGGERYDPPIPLLKYPMNVGDEWDWSGNIVTGPEPHKTKAKIATTNEDMTINGGTVHNVVRVEVLLSIESGRPSEPSTRKLKFWIAPDMGVVKRSFGDYSTRGPLDE